MYAHAYNNPCEKTLLKLQGLTSQICPFAQRREMHLSGFHKTFSAQQRAKARAYSAMRLVIIILSVLHESEQITSAYKVRK